MPLTKMLPQYFDIHNHVNDKQFDSERDTVFERMRERNVWGILVGTDYESSQEVAMLASISPSGIYAAVGIHPTDTCCERFPKIIFDELVIKPRVVAVGECGIDYSCLSEVDNIEKEKERQRNLFNEQVDFAIEHNLPLMLHVRDCNKDDADAHLEVLTILKEKKDAAGGALRGNVHFFSQTIDIAREYFALDFTISFTGVITFTDEYNDVISKAPLDRIMSETDSPYVAPVPYRGKRNEPIYVEEVVKKIAEIRGEDFETVRAALVKNALRVFNITPYI
jgi:TatD DNase family protein